MTDTKSPISEEQASLLIHFYEPNRRTPVWQKALWRPKYAHVCVEWRGMIHDMPYDGPAEVYDAPEFKADNAPDHTIRVPHQLSLDDEVRVVPFLYDQYEGKTVEKWKVIRWYLGRKLDMPLSCATLVSHWIRVFAFCNIKAVTADELYQLLISFEERDYAVR